MEGIEPIKEISGQIKRIKRLNNKNKGKKSINLNVCPAKNKV